MNPIGTRTTQIARTSAVKKPLTLRLLLAAGPIAFALLGTSLSGCSDASSPSASNTETWPEPPELAEVTSLALTQATSCKELQDEWLSNYVDAQMYLYQPEGKKPWGLLSEKEKEELKQQWKNNYPEGFPTDEQGPLGSAAPQGTSGGTKTTDSAPAAGAPPTETAGGGTVPKQPNPSYTGTNNHESAADESDKVKTTGLYTFILSDSTLSIVKTWSPDKLATVASINLYPFGSIDDAVADRTAPPHSPIYDPFQKRIPNTLPNFVYGTALSIEGDTLFAYLTITKRLATSSLKVNELTRVLSYDISNPETPKLKNVYDLPGRFTEARTVASGTWLIQNAFATNSFYGRVEKGQGNPEDQVHKLIRDYLQQNLNHNGFWNGDRDLRIRYREHAKKELIKKIYDLFPELSNRSPVSSYTYSVRNHALKPIGKPKPISCDHFYLSPIKYGNNYLVVTRIPSETNGTLHPVAVSATANVVYSNGSSLYAVNNIYETDFRWRKRTSAAIYKFAFPTELNTTKPVSPPYEVTYAASAIIPGMIENQFNISEYKDHLRVSTNVTPLRGYWEVNENSNTRVVSSEDSRAIPERWTDLTVLKQEGSSLKAVGKIGKLAPNELIYSTRFIGDKGYVVTFRQVDPLFVFDLSNPEKPRKLGELKIPGYSTYIHPLGPNFLLTIGRKGTELGTVAGLQLQIFDVTDPKKPTQKWTQDITYTSTNGKNTSVASSAELSAHSFTFDAQRGILSIPFSAYTYNTKTNQPDHIFGFQFYAVSAENGVQKLGTIEHTEFVRKNICSVPNTRLDTYCGRNEATRYTDAHWRPDFSRSIIMTGQQDGGISLTGAPLSKDQTYLYTLTNASVLVSRLSAPSTIYKALYLADHQP